MVCVYVKRRHAPKGDTIILREGRTGITLLYHMGRRRLGGTVRARRRDREEGGCEKTGRKEAAVSLPLLGWHDNMWHKTDIKAKKAWAEKEEGSYLAMAPCLSLAHHANLHDSLHEHHAMCLACRRGDNTLLEDISACPHPSLSHYLLPTSISYPPSPHIPPLPLVPLSQIWLSQNF